MSGLFLRKSMQDCENDIRERGLRLAGLTPRYADDYDRPAQGE